MTDQQQVKTYGELLKKNIFRFSGLLARPFIDFYYNYGLSRASILSYILCVNLVVFVYIFLSNPTLDPPESSFSTKRFLELHFLWPTPPKYLIQAVPDGFSVRGGDIISQNNFFTLRREIEAKLPELEREDFQYVEFSLSSKLGEVMWDATQNFFNLKKQEIIPSGIGTSFWIILMIAYLALLLNLKTNLAESVSPLIWGNLPLNNRRSQILKILWRIPSFNVIKSRIYLLCILPILVLLAITLLSWCHRGIDKMVVPYSTMNTALTASISFIITGLMFATLYKINVSGISRRNALIGAFLAAALWLGGRWLFTSYAGASLYRNLRNFAFIPMFLTWFYYLCSVFLFGLYVSHTLENPELTSTGRSWAMRDFTVGNRYTTLSMWLRLDFLYQLARNRYEEYPPPFISIKLGEDTADEIAQKSNLPPHFVRECILEMITQHPEAFSIEVSGNKQYCRLKLPPEEVEVISLLIDEGDIRTMHQEMEQYTFGNFVMERFGAKWNSSPICLDTIYQDYKAFSAKAAKAT